MLRFVVVWFFVFFQEVSADSKKIEPMNLKVSVSGLHSKIRSRELIFNNDRKVFEKKQKKKD